MSPPTSYRCCIGTVSNKARSTQPLPVSIGVLSSVGHFRSTFELAPDVVDASPSEPSSPNPTTSSASSLPSVAHATRPLPLDRPNDPSNVRPLAHATDPSACEKPPAAQPRLQSLASPSRPRVTRERARRHRTIVLGLPARIAYSLPTRYEMEDATWNARKDCDTPYGVANSFKYVAP